MGFLSRLTHIDADEVSLVKRGANRRRHLLLKGDDDVAELEDMASVPVEYEGALTDYLRKEGVDESAIEAAVVGCRLLKAAEGELPEDVRELVEKLGSQMYPIVNKPLNNMDGADNPNDGPNDDASADMDAQPGPTDMAKAEGTPLEKADSDPDEDNDDDSHENDSDGVDVAKADLSTAGRKAMASRGLARPDGSFPIPNVGYLKRAIRAFGRAGDKAGAKAWIKRRAAALGRTDLLPDSWGSGATVNKEGTMSEGTAAVPVPIQKDDGTWDLSGVPEESRGFYETFLKANDDVKKERDDLLERVEKAESKVAEERELRLGREFIAKAEEYGHIADADELGPVLKEIAGAISEESFEVLTKALASAEERIAKSGLFEELGRSHGGSAESAGDAWSQIEKLAADMVEKTEGMTEAKAIDVVLKTNEGRRLYQQYLVETSAGRMLASASRGGE